MGSDGGNGGQVSLAIWMPATVSRCAVIPSPCVICLFMLAMTGGNAVACSSPIAPMTRAGMPDHESI
jgi:hypothetical protein